MEAPALFSEGHKDRQGQGSEVKHHRVTSSRVIARMVVLQVWSQKSDPCSGSQTGQHTPLLVQRNTPTQWFKLRKPRGRGLLQRWEWSAGEWCWNKHLKHPTQQHASGYSCDKPEVRTAWIHSVKHGRLTALRSDILLNLLFNKTASILWLYIILCINYSSSRVTTH